MGGKAVKAGLAVCSESVRAVRESTQGLFVAQANAWPANGPESHSNSIVRLVVNDKSETISFTDKRHTLLVCAGVVHPPTATGGVGSPLRGTAAPSVRSVPTLTG